MCINLSFENLFSIATAVCDVGYKFEGYTIGEELTSNCRPQDGTWSKSVFPQCIGECRNF